MLNLHYMVFITSNVFVHLCCTDILPRRKMNTNVSVFLWWRTWS